jgi:hypothetical protein
MQIVLKTEPETPRQLDNTTFAVMLTNPDGKLYRHADVTIELTMPGMSMPPIVVTPPADQSGGYIGGGQFTMPGKWIATVKAKSAYGGAAPTEAHKDFPITVSP